MLTSYTATLHPSDRALLRLLQRYETMGEVDMSPYQPLCWGAPAVQRYNNNNGAGWKQAKCSEVLSLLSPETMRATCDRFPTNLGLDPEADIEDEPDQGLYDPRFVLPLLSHLLTSDIYIDKHIKFLEVGALNLAMSALASRDKAMRTAGYHVLARLNSALMSAKLSQEKQVWIHLVSLLR